MKLPSRDFVLAGGLFCPTHEVERGVWQQHVLKHPLGIGAIAERCGRDPWNQEGWDKLAPAVITEDERTALLGEITALEDAEFRCELPELRGKKKLWSDPERLACRVCHPSVVESCDNLTNAPGRVGVRYRDVTESLLAELTADAGVQVELGRFHQTLHRLWRDPEKLLGAVVLTVGLDDRSAARPIARINRGDGVRAEFYLEEPDRLRWRTTYRALTLVRTAPLAISFLGAVPRPAAGLGRVSELCVVARRWWETHGI